MSYSGVNFEKQWKAASRQADLEVEFCANFQVSHPNVMLVQVHDSWLFQSKEDCQLFTDELEQFLEERKG